MNLENKTTPENDHSEEILDIISSPPSWIIKWGILLLIGAAAIIIFISTTLSYPTTVDANVYIISGATLLAQTEHRENGIDLKSISRDHYYGITEIDQKDINQIHSGIKTLITLDSRKSNTGKISGIVLDQSLLNNKKRTFTVILGDLTLKESEQRDYLTGKVAIIVSQQSLFQKLSHSLSDSFRLK